jgi:NitT/TauT family transport system permease protein
MNTIAGFENTDSKLLEMASVFHISCGKKLFYIYRPAVLPYLISGCRVALGMSWKSGIAAEVIGVPVHSIGEKLYMSKIYLSTADLFAWTLVIIIISALFEKLFLYLLYLASPGSLSKKLEV